MANEQGKVRSGAMQEWINKLNTSNEVFIDPPSGWAYGFPALWNRAEYPNVGDFLRSKGYPEDQITFAVGALRMWLPEQNNG